MSGAVPSTLESAQALAEHGVAVHWLRPKSKAPVADEWSKAAVNTPATLSATWREGCNIGIRLGEWSKVGGLFLHAIDMDIRVADKAEEALAHLKRMLPDVDDFPFVISGSGGASRHFYFLTERPFRYRKLYSSKERFTDAAGKSHLTWEIELFGTGKQVACPPSIHPDTGIEYKWGRPLDFDLIDMDLGPVVAAETVQGWGVSSGEIAEEEDELTAEIHRAPLDIDDEQVQGVLNDLPFDQYCEDRDGWREVGMALHHQYEGSAKGLEMWTAFSKKSTKFDAKDQRRVWESFKSTPRPMTMRSLIQVVGSKKADDDLLIDGYPLTEDGMALAFANRFKDKLKFCHSSGRWYVWTGTHWKREETHLAFDWVRTTCRKHAEKADSKSAAVKALSRAATATAVEKFARVDRGFAVTAEVWDRDPWLLGTPTGTVELKTGRLRPAHPKDLITRLTAAGPIPLESFDPERDCPRWLAFLRQALNGDAEAIRFFQQWVGYCLTGNTDLQALLFVHGEGGTGKSTAINTIGDLLGDYCVNVEPETLVATKFDRHSTELARLHGPRMARSTETKQGTAWHESRIKALTGGDVVTARFMRQDNFEFRPQFKVNVVGNHAPRIINCDEAMRRRFNVLPFNVKPAVRDLTLADTLKTEEGSCILSWGVVGCLDLQANGLVRPGVVRAATDAYFAEQDTFAQWLEEECELGKGYVETNERLWESWVRFATLSGEDPGSRSKNFPARLVAKGFESVRDTAVIRGRGFKGLRVIENNGFNDLSDDDDLVG